MNGSGLSKRLSIESAVHKREMSSIYEYKPEFTPPLRLA